MAGGLRTLSVSGSVTSNRLARDLASQIYFVRVNQRLRVTILLIVAHRRSVVPIQLILVGGRVVRRV